MSAHEPGAAFRALPDDPTPLPLRRRRQQRVVFAGAVLVATIAAFAANEAQHWQLGVDLGFSFRPESSIVEEVVPDGIAARAGVPMSRRLWMVDDEELLIGGSGFGWRYVRSGDHLLVDSFRRAYLPAATTAPVRFRFDDDTDDHVCATPFDVMLTATAPPQWLRLPQAPFVLPLLLPVVIVVSFAAAAIGGRLQRRRSTLASSLLQRERSVRWPAFVTAVVLPMWAHVLMLAAMGPELFWTHYLPVAVMTTTLPHLLLVFLAMRGATGALDGDHTPMRRVPFVVLAIIPGALFVVPTALALLIGLLLLRALRKDARLLMVDQA